ncbi:cell wall hydrolase [Methyloversatilis sp.]|uniref:cell wall hydrolase n=1 Tax=Methyloversatilis sp. TaxID=2569862 RepID=UPI0035B4898D
MILASALLCLSLNIYHEARGESLDGQYAVAQVTMNRAGDSSKVCEEVMKPKQFSWANKMVRNGRLLSAGYPKDQKAWHRAKTMARMVLSQRLVNMLPDVHFYHHATKSKPRWRNHMIVFADIGNHRFYRYERNI